MDNCKIFYNKYKNWGVNGDILYMKYEEFEKNIITDIIKINNIENINIKKKLLVSLLKEPNKLKYIYSYYEIITKIFYKFLNDFNLKLPQKNSVIINIDKNITAHILEIFYIINDNIVEIINNENNNSNIKNDNNDNYLYDNHKLNNNLPLKISDLNENMISSICQLYGYDSIDELYKLNPNIENYSIGYINNIFNKNEFKKYIKQKDDNFVYL